MGIRTKKEEPKSKPTYQEYISASEFRLREKAWETYYTKIHTTRAYKLYIQAKEALKRDDKKLLREIGKEARELISSKNTELPCPPYPDPNLERRRNRLGVYEWDTDRNIVKAAQELFSA